jgi:hypothetical protein
MTMARLTRDGTEYEISGPAPADRTYPRTETYTFGEFAGPVIEAAGRPAAVVEFGGYADVSLVDPWTGRRLWIPRALPDLHGHDGGTAEGCPACFDDGAGARSLLAAIRKALDVAEETGFFAEQAAARA